MADDVRARDERLFIASLQKGLHVLELMGQEDDEVGLQQIADLAGLSKSMAQRIVHTLWQLRYVDQNPQTRKFRLSSKVYLNGYARFQNSTVFRLAQEQLLGLNYETGETCALAVLEGWEMVVVQAIAGRFADSLNLSVGMRFLADQATSGRLFLAWLDPETRIRLAKGASEQSEVDARLERLRSLEREFEQVRRDGYLATIGAIVQGNASVSAPILDNTGRARAAVNVSMPAARYRDFGPQRLAGLVQAAATTVSAQLGFRPNDPSEPPARAHADG